MKRAYFYDTSCGKIGLAEEDGAITNVFFGNTVSPKEFTQEETPLLKQAAAQLKEYLAGKRQKFDIFLCPRGTEFECQVWWALKEIPYGETKTYSEIAKALGRPGASRAVGRAVSQNPLSIFLPCHRVIGKDGSLTGYAGGLKMKKFLLELERINK
ncbi:methylated-DNA--[protein]-cysteine S-methyltransferase [Youxingia wuxianensis]|uniref:Methylated-DNA--protein-cysteine methyltransferase n=1 Tax=Youxingia wuxianensis TaxID=2763678 RepID=A0A926ENW3_9FIRM|nr:methylated-DNA--[protein]-cysteine S-methyltransferase [Youxingia wuxianensis]MBC8584002.1 methylated-DNA--[protein]-cysteine S-methyltransferase [Youxingia wuxianensis]